MSDTNIQEIEVDETDLDEMINELIHEAVPEKKSFRVPRWIRQMIVRPKKLSPMVEKFRRLAGIVKRDTVATLVLPNGTLINFTELPPWHLVLRYKLCGFTYYEKE
jgi:hypothetical protein